MAIIGLGVAVVGVGVRLIAAFGPPKSERVKNALGYAGYAVLVIGLLMLVGVAWELPFTFQWPVRWSVATVELRHVVSQNLPKTVAERYVPVSVVPLSRSIYISQITVDLSRATKDGDLIFSVTAFNGSEHAIVLGKLVGSIRWEIGASTTPLTMFADPPRVDPELTTSHPAYAPFSFSFQQHMSLATAQAKAFAGGQSLDFSFQDLTIGVRTKTPPAQEQVLTLWNGIVCRRGTTTDVFYSHVVSIAVPPITTEGRLNESPN